MTQDIVQTERHDAVFVLKLHRPEKFNALNTALRTEIVAALRPVRHDDSIRAVVIWGGDKVFAAGADLQEMLDRRPMQAMRHINNAPDMTEAVTSLRQPTIAAIAGLALGGGLELALAADLRLAASNARLGQPEINVGLLPGAGGTQRLTRYVGLTKAKEMILLGEPIDAAEALRIGLINKIVEPEQLFEEALTWARKLAAKPMYAARLAKLVIDKGYDAEIGQAITMEALAFSSAFGTADQREGARAFVEKRRPNFPGEPA